MIHSRENEAQALVVCVCMINVDAHMHLDISGHCSDVESWSCGGKEKRMVSPVANRCARLAFGPSLFLPGPRALCYMP